MKLADHLTIRLSFIFLVIFLVWSVIYFLVQMYEIHDGIDEGLVNLKQEFLIQANNDSNFVQDMRQYNPLNIIVENIAEEDALEVKEYFSTGYIYFPSEEEEEEVRMLTTAFFNKHDGKYYKLRIFTSAVESEDLIKNMLYLLIGLWVCLGIVLVVAGKLIVQKANKPFYKLLADLSNFQLDKSQMIVLPSTPIKEFEELNKSIEILLKDNLKIFNEQKTFIENVSHELQTPVSIATNKLEIMMHDQNLAGKQVEQINSVLTVLSRMKKMNSNLLLLSKIKNHQFPESVSLNLKFIFQEVFETYQDLLDHKQIILNQNVNGDMWVKINQDLAHILVNNLVKNAVSHNVQGGTISILYLNNKIEISNDGPKRDNINIFERYTSGSTNLESHGLGLSIVKSIVDTYNLGLDYKYENKHIITLSIKSN